MFKFKKMLKQALAITCALAILLCGVPMFASADAVPTAEDSLLLFKGDGTDGVAYHPGGAATGTRTFSATTDATFWNNILAAMPAPVDISAYDNITFTLNIASQAEYDVWKYHTLIYFGPDIAYPMPTDLKEGDNLITLDLNYLRKLDFDLTNFTGFGIYSVLATQWNNGAYHFTLIDTGWTNDQGVNFTFTMKDAYANKAADDGSTLIDAGYYKPFGDMALSFNWANHNVINSQTPIDLTPYKYFNFDIYISDADMLRAEVDGEGNPVWSFYLLRFINSNGDLWHYAASASELRTGYNTVSIPVSDIPESHVSDICQVMMYQESNGAVFTPKYNYFIGAVNFRGSDYPTASNKHPYVIYQKNGLVWNWSKEAGGTLTWQDCTFIDSGNNININDAQYMELDVIANTEFPNFALWLSTGYGYDPDRRHYTVGNLNAGKNHIVIDLTQYDNAYEPGGFDKTKIKTILLSDLDTSADYNLEFCNVAFTSDLSPSPAMNNIYGGTVFAKEGSFSNSFIATTNEGIQFIYPNNFPSFNGGKGVDTTEAKYIEFDVYSDVATTGNLNMWLTSNTGTGSGRRIAIGRFPALNAGWNHICIDLDSFVSNGGEWVPEQPYDRACIKEMFLEGTFTTANPEEHIPLNLRFANIAFTKVNDMQNVYPTLINTAREGMFLERSYNIGSHSLLDWSGGWGTIFLDTLTGSHAWEDGTEKVPMDVSAAKYVEFDFYVSADVPDGIKLWLSNYESTNSGKRGAHIGELKKGWTHICLPLNAETFSEVNPPDNMPSWEWDLTALKTLLVELVAAANDPTVTRIDYKIANVAFTDDACTVTWNVDGNITTETYAVGEMPSYKGSVDKAKEGNVIYTFAGWDPQLAPVAGDITYTARYVSREYLVGDVDNSETVDIVDLIVLKKALLEGEYYMDIYDIDLDNDFTATDIVALRKLLFEKF